MEQSLEGTIFQQPQEPSLRRDMLYIVALVVQSRRLVATVTLVAAVTALLVSFIFMPNWYASTVNAVPPRRQTSGLESLTSGLSSALKDFGLAKVGKSSSETYSYSVILNSRRMKDTIIRLFRLHTIYRLDSTEWTDLRKEYDDHVFISNEADGNYLITVLHTDRYEAVRMAMKIYELGNYFADEIFQQEARISLGLLEKRLAQADSSLMVARDTLLKFARKYKLFAALDQARAAASAIADIRVKQYQQEMNVEIARGIYGDNAPETAYLRDLLRKANEQATRIESQPGLAGNFSIAEVGADIALEYMRLYADFEVFTKIKALLIPIIEQNRQDIYRRQPSLVLLDPPVPADKKERPKRSLIILGATLAAFLLSVAFVILRDRYYALRATYKELFDHMLKQSHC
ncbi:MAG: Wzz/FepE/Etk N-terminal domain-containing protein [Bacteroidota bacterium]|nr:Wzz/FepE/Etk N-terminal domain-containing protein [Candidatus Kapabacteria bacterium]MDW8219734.1 Wzz/FepE/Etk N-terminal domain-containing protein [Bacteroidota bacterium]